MKECRECGSARIIEDVLAVDRADYNTDLGFKVAIHENPDALVFKGANYSSTRTDVCGDCGYIAIYAKDLDVLWRAYQNRESNR